MKILNSGIFDLQMDHNRACMDFNPQNPKYTEELINSSFNRECEFLHKVNKYNWSPKNLEINSKDRKIYFDWFNNTGDNYLPNNWESQLENIVRDLHYLRIYKPNLYMKNFFTDSNEILHAYVFYSSSSYDEQPISMNFYKPLLNEDRLALVDTLTVDEKLHMKVLIEHAYTNYIDWPCGALKQIYHKVYE